MNWSDLHPGDIAFKNPLGKYPIWMYMRPIGTRLGEYMDMETGTRVEGSRENGLAFAPGWEVWRDGALLWKHPVQEDRIQEDE